MVGVLNVREIKRADILFNDACQYEGKATPIRYVIIAERRAASLYRNDG